jgi:hypothetical protein
MVKPETGVERPFDEESMVKPETGVERPFDLPEAGKSHSTDALVERSFDECRPRCESAETREPEVPTAGVEEDEPEVLESEAKIEDEFFPFFDLLAAQEASEAEPERLARSDIATK